ncbi:DoxX family protein [Paenibacillus koleovorans]|uniref:DoxX family protein n=1 Tax=Paenibacillus koleovorans TaxID=121608 RepID=UPI000FDAE22D|nr:DoxX family protein [Paenibacillus koleovorans]
MNKQKAKTIAYWATTILGPFSFVIGGTFFLLHGEQQISVLETLNYPEYMLTILGFWKLTGAIVSVLPRLPRLKEWVYAGFFFELSGAAISHAYSGADLFTIIQPIVFLILVMASWALRPASRKL